MNAISKSLAAAFTALCSPLLYAQACPAKHIKFMVGFATGGAADVTARMLAPKLSELLGQQVIIENRGGSGGMLATDAVAKSAPDGYTLLLMPAADTVHVPYKGISDDVTAVASGEVDMIFASIPASLPLLTAKRVRALAVTTGQRTPLAPAMPTLNESGVPGYDRSGWYGVLAPANVPSEIVSRLNAAIVKIVGTPEMKQAFMKQGLDPATSTPEAFAMFIRDEIAQNIKLVKAAGIKVE